MSFQVDLEVNAQQIQNLVQFKEGKSKATHDFLIKKFVKGVGSTFKDEWNKTTSPRSGELLKNKYVHNSAIMDINEPDKYHMSGSVGLEFDDDKTRKIAYSHEFGSDMKPKNAKVIAAPAERMGRDVSFSDLKNIPGSWVSLKSTKGQWIRTKHGVIVAALYPSKGGLKAKAPPKHIEAVHARRHKGRTDRSHVGGLDPSKIIAVGYSSYRIDAKHYWAKTVSRTLNRLHSEWKKWFGRIRPSPKEQYGRKYHYRNGQWSWS